MTLERSHTFTIEMPIVGQLPPLLAATFSHCSAEAQMLEHNIKTAITNDVKTFAAAHDQVSFLDILEKTTLGQAKMIAQNTSKHPQHKQIMDCVGFFDLVEMQWSTTGRPENELTALLKDAVDRRNRVAHQLLAEVLHKAISPDDAVKFLNESRDLFFQVRQLIVTADKLSSKFGSVASDGSSQPRVKTT